MRSFLSSRAILLACLPWAFQSVLATDAAIYQFDIPSEELSTALREFATVTHQQIIFDSKRIAGLKSQA
jgi:hypothetical protein